MNIIVVGNVFDLAHGLPTKYTDFLEFVKVIKNILETKDINCIKYSNINSQIKSLIEKNMPQEAEQWNNLLNNNFWIEYFFQSNMHGKENWIDFESEISKLIQSLHIDIYEKEETESLYEDIKIIFSNDFLENYTYVKYPEKFIIYKDIKNQLYNDLNKLIKALEIYLYHYINKMNCERKSPDIEEILASERICNILSFNYTNTIEKIYLNKIDSFVNEANIDIDYIHGKANKYPEIEKNNMVLGIDEFLSLEKQNIYIEFVEFKKFYQRIYKETGCKYKSWVDEIKKEQVWYGGYEKHNLYIYGHSLDITDGDILRDLILNDNINTTIFYHDKETMGKQIANLVKVIGESELIKRTGGSTKTI